MIALSSGSLDTSNLVALAEIFDKNHKEQISEQLFNSILEKDPNNKFALKRLAEYYKNTNDDRVWELYEQIVKLDFEEADIAKILADRFVEQSNADAAVSYYKKALLRYIGKLAKESKAKSITPVKEVWGKLIKLIPEEIEFFLLAQQKLDKALVSSVEEKNKESEREKSIPLMMDLYQYYKNISNWDTAIRILKLVLSIDKKDISTRRELVECFRGKYSANPHTEDYIKTSNLNQSFRDVFEAINDFEKHIAFDANRYVFHRRF